MQLFICYAILRVLIQPDDLLAFIFSFRSLTSHRIHGKSDYQTNEIHAARNHFMESTNDNIVQKIKAYAAYSLEVIHIHDILVQCQTNVSYMNNILYQCADQKRW